jgi:hypothetical protein
LDPATALLILKGLLDLLPLAAQQVSIFRERGEYTEEEWAAVKAQVAAWKTDPAWQEEPDPAP